MKLVPRGQIFLQRQAIRETAAVKTVSLDGRRIKPSSCDGQSRLVSWSHYQRERGSNGWPIARASSLDDVLIV